MRRDPGLGMLHNVHPAPLHASPARLGLRMLGEIVVEIEAAIQARRQSLAVENDRADKGGGVVAVLLHQFRQSRMGRRQRYGKIGHAVAAGQQSGQNAGVGGIGDRAGGKRLAEADSVLGQGVECGRLNGFVPVTVDVVRAQSVDGDEINVGRREINIARERFSLRLRCRRPLSGKLRA